MALTKKAVFVSRAKPPWPSATRKWPIRKTLRTLKPWPTRPRARTNHNPTSPANIAKAVAVAVVAGATVVHDAAVAVATADLGAAVVAVADTAGLATNLDS